MHCLINLFDTSPSHNQAKSVQSLRTAGLGFSYQGEAYPPIKTVGGWEFGGQLFSCMKNNVYIHFSRRLVPNLNPLYVWKRSAQTV